MLNQRIQRFVANVACVCVWCVVWCGVVWCGVHGVMCGMVYMV